jgi:hypothetical protein
LAKASLIVVDTTLAGWLRSFVLICVNSATLQDRARILEVFGELCRVLPRQVVRIRVVLIGNHLVLESVTFDSLASPRHLLLLQAAVCTVARLARR